MKKVILICMSIIFAIMLSIGLMADDNSEFIAVNELPVDIYSQIVNTCESDPNYGGAYFKNGVLHIASTNSETTKTNILSNYQISYASNGSTIYTVEDAEYTYDELYTAKELLWANRVKYGIVGIYPDAEMNSVVVESYVDISDNIDEMIELTGIERIHFKIVVEEEYDDASLIYMRCGERLTVENKLRCSLAAGIIFPDGTRGYLSTAHGVSVGDKYKYNEVEIGTAEIVVYGGKFDIALIRRTNTNYSASKVMSDGITESSYNGTPILHDSITMYGAKTGSSAGQILAINANFMVNGFEFTDMIKSNYKRDSGDSGGAIIAHRSEPYNNVFVGIHKGCSGGYPVATNWKLVSDEFNLNIWAPTEK